MNSNHIIIKDTKGTAEILIENIKLKNVSNYKVNRDTDKVNLMFALSVSPKNFTLNMEKTSSELPPHMYPI